MGHDVGGDKRSQWTGTNVIGNAHELLEEESALMEMSQPLPLGPNEEAKDEPMQRSRSKSRTPRKSRRTRKPVKHEM